MTEESKPDGDGTEEVKQEPLTVIPVASILMLVELLEVLKEELPAVNGKLIDRVQLLKNTTVGKQHPRSIKLFEAIVREGSGL